MANSENERLPTVEQAEAFVAVAEYGSFQDAAAELGINRTALVRRVDRLQRLIGGEPLLKRGGRARTPTGDRVLTQAQRVMDAARGMLRPSTEVRLSTYPTIAAHVVAACSDLFDRLETPVVLYDINEGSRHDRGARLIRQLADGDVDIVIAPSQHERLGLKATKLYEWTLQVVLAKDHPLLEELFNRQLHVADIEGLQIVAAPRPHSSRQILEEMFADEDRSLHVAFESPNQRLLQQLALNTKRYVAAIPSDAFWPTVEQGHGVDLLDAGGKPRGRWYDVFTRPSDASGVHDGRERVIKDAADLIGERLGQTAS